MLIYFLLSCKQYPFDQATITRILHVDSWYIIAWVYDTNTQNNVENDTNTFIISVKIEIILRFFQKHQERALHDNWEEIIATQTVV